MALATAAQSFCSKTKDTRHIKTVHERKQNDVLRTEFVVVQPFWPCHPATDVMLPLSGHAKPFRTRRVVVAVVAHGLLLFLNSLLRVLSLPPLILLIYFFANVVHLKKAMSGRADRRLLLRQINKTTTSERSESGAQDEREERRETIGIEAEGKIDTAVERKEARASKFSVIVSEKEKRRTDRSTRGKGSKKKKKKEKKEMGFGRLTTQKAFWCIAALSLLYLWSNQVADVLPGGAGAPEQDQEIAKQWFKEAKLGMLIHWGLYSVLEKGELVIVDDEMTMKDYEQVAQDFNPTQWNATELVKFAKSIGFKYITFTVKHHDGFLMYKSKEDDFNVFERTPLKRDVFRELSEACHHYEMKLFVYYSLIDWHHPDYPLEGLIRSIDRSSLAQRYNGILLPPNFNNYVLYVERQLGELLTQYDSIAGVWFDGMWDNPKLKWPMNRIYELVHNLQSRGLIGNNHKLQKPLAGENFIISKQSALLEDYDEEGEDTYSSLYERLLQIYPREFSAKTTDSKSLWAYHKEDKFKDEATLIELLVRSVAVGSNLLLNVGLNADGVIPPTLKTSLTKVGEWMRLNSESIYGTTAGPFQLERSRIFTTAGCNYIYLHILINFKNPSPDTQDLFVVGEYNNMKHYLISLPRVLLLGKTKIKAIASAVFLASGEEQVVCGWGLEASQDMLLFEIPERFADEADTVIKIRLVPR
eukprot:TRINITY_DN1373_c0_g1_i2.p1 TRINITY_DN1373_c0_g1~~TRINITY_DN1373_c0_g1_i2.p1  ORF type:complete len:700 (+),score=147.22 TRINITY_DN1373_c0_g1_i2:1228-3327(+)